MCRVNLTLNPDNVNDWIARQVDIWTIESKPTLDKTPEGMSNRIAEIINAMEPHIAAADLVALEGQSSFLKGSSAQVLPWLWGRIVDTTTAHATELVIVPPSLRMKYATGKGNAQKDAVLAAAIRRFPDVDISGNDTADAVILAAIGCRHLGLPIDDMPKAQWEPVMAKVR